MASTIIKPPTAYGIAGIIQRMPKGYDRDLAMRAFMAKYGKDLSFEWKTPEATELEAQGWEVWLSELAPHVFDQSFASFHREYWDWYWALLVAKRDGVKLSTLGVPLAYLLTLGRGMGKSSTVEWDNIALGALLGRTIGLYISSTGDLAEGHLKNIQEEIEGSRLAKYYPGLAGPQVGKFNNRYGWNQALLATKSGLTLFAVGLQSEVRGIKRMNLRPAKITLDEFDSKNDSADVVKTKEAIIGGSIFGTQAQTGDTIITMAQNLIHANSVATRTFKRRNLLLSNRKESGLIRAFTNDLEIKMVGVLPKITKGKPTWPHLNMAVCQKYLEDSGPVEFFCHPAGTLVATADGVSPIEKLKTRQLVVSHTGMLRRITGTSERLYSGSLVLIRRAGRSGFVRATPEHRFYVARPKVSRSVFYKHRCNPELLRYSWMPAQELRPGDYLVEPVPKPTEELLDDKVVWRFTPMRFGSRAKGPHEIVASKALCRLIGYYLAEGNADQGQVRFDFHEKETIYHDDVLTLGKQVFGCNGRVRPSHGRGVTVGLNSTIAKRFFETFGRGSRRKFIPSWVFRLSPSLCREILVGYIRGDGNKTKAGFGFASASLQLAEGIRRLLMYCGIASSLYKLPPRTLRLPQGCDYTRGDFWMGAINGTEAVKLGGILGVPHVRFRRHSGTTFIHGDYTHARVNDIHSLQVESLPVYNLHVAHDHSFIADGAASHNCEYQHVFDKDKEGKVMKNYFDAIHVISEQEFCRAYGIEWHPGFRVPIFWYKFVFNDKARTNSESHVNAAGTLTMSSQNSRLPGITYLFDALSFEEASEPDDVALALLRCISPIVRVNGIDRTWQELRRSLISRKDIANFVGSVKDEIAASREGVARVFPKQVAPLLAAYNYKRFRMSHEADDWRRVYRETFGLPFEAANPGKGEGQALVNLAMEIDLDVADPFKRIGYWSEDRQTFIRDQYKQDPRSDLLMGMSRWYMIVKEDKLPYPNDAKPDLLHGSDRARYQFTEQRYTASKLNALGETEGEPEKRNDDFSQGLLMFYMDNSIRARELTEEEKQDLSLPPAIQNAAIEAETDPARKEQLHYSREASLRKQAAGKIAEQLAGGGGRSGSRLSGYRKLTRRGGT